MRRDQRVYGQCRAKHQARRQCQRASRESRKSGSTQTQRQRGPQYIMQMVYTCSVASERQDPGGRFRLGLRNNAVCWNFVAEFAHAIAGSLSRAGRTSDSSCAKAEGKLAAALPPGFLRGGNEADLNHRPHAFQPQAYQIPFVHFTP
jgi:hypothetical protein